MINKIPNFGIKLTHKLLECNELFIQLSIRIVRSLLRNKNFIATEQEIYLKCVDWARNQAQLQSERAAAAEAGGGNLRDTIGSESDGKFVDSGAESGGPGNDVSIEQKRKNTSNYLNFIKKLKYDIRMPLLGLKFYQKKLANKRILTKDEETLLTKYWKLLDKSKKTGNKLTNDNNIIKKISKIWINYNHRHPFLNLKQNSKIELNLEDIINLTDLFDNKSLYDINNIHLNLLYNGTDNKFLAEKFHLNCDNNIYPTFTLIKPNNKYNNIFGGFTCEKWKGYGYAPDNNAFIFLLKRDNNSPVNDDINSKIIGPCKWSVIEDKVANSIYRNEKYGPRFGEGADICIVDQCNQESGSYANIGVTYNAPNDPLLLAGEKKFLIDEYEVWAIMP